MRRGAGLGNPRPTDNPEVRAALLRANMQLERPLVSEVSEVEAKTLVTKYPSDNHLFGTLYNINLYRGCGHGCIYCDTRSECYGIIDISRVSIKKNAIELLRKELTTKRQKGVVGTGSMNDPDMPLEEKWGLTRQTLEVLLEYGFGVHVITKSALVLRDLDLLMQLARTTHAMVSFSITTVDNGLAKQLEPGAAPPNERLRAMGVLRKAGVHSGALLMTLLPGLTDNEASVSRLVAALVAVQAEYALPGCLTLRNAGRAYFYARLAKVSPAALALTKEIYGNRYTPPDDYAHRVYSMANKVVRAAGLAMEVPRWCKLDSGVEQLRLF